MRNLRAFALAGVLGIAGLAAPAIAAPGSNMDPRLTEILSDPQAILNVIPAVPDSITKVDPTVGRVFIYNERKREDTDALASVVENRLAEELIRLRRFKLIEARETKVARIQSDSNTFQVSNTIESLARLRQMGTQLGADAALMFAPQVQDRMVLVSAKLVRISDGEILWTERFAYNFDLQRAVEDEARRAEEQAKLEADRKRAIAEKRTRDNGLYIYTELSGFSMRRKAIAGTDATDEISQTGGGIGFMGLRTMGFNENAAFGFDINLQQQGSVNQNVSLPTVSVGPMFLFRLDPIFVRGDNDGVVNLYIAPEETFMFEKTLQLQTTGKFGLMIRFVPEWFFNLGAVYYPTQTVTFTSSNATAKLENTSDFGGLTYLAGFGFAFK